MFDRETVQAAFWSHRRDLVAMLASNTSTIAVKKELFTKLGGFDAGYLDHGLEDFDFLLRLSLETTELPVPSDIVEDTRSQSPAFSRGFRSYLNILSLPVFLRGIFTVHRWHPHPAVCPYYGHRRDNLELLRKNILETVARVGQGPGTSEWAALLRPDGTYNSLRIVEKLVEAAGRTPFESSALFDNVPQRLFHGDRQWRQFKKLLSKWRGALLR